MVINAYGYVYLIIIKPRVQDRDAVKESLHCKEFKNGDSKGKNEPLTIHWNMPHPQYKLGSSFIS